MAVLAAAAYGLSYLVVKLATGSQELASIAAAMAALIVLESRIEAALDLVRVFSEAAAAVAKLLKTRRTI